jgi:hypothetical protein
VELGVLFDARLPAAHLLRLPPQDVLEPGQLLLGGVGSGAGRQGRLDHPADIEKLGHELALVREHARQRHHQRVSRQVADHRAAAVTGLDDAHHLQRADGVAQRAAADANFAPAPLVREANRPA